MRRGCCARIIRFVASPELLPQSGGSVQGNHDVNCGGHRAANCALARKGMAASGATESAVGMTPRAFATESVRTCRLRQVPQKIRDF